MKELHKILISDYQNWKGENHDVTLSYQVAGPGLGEAPVVLVCHALTGNSSVAGPDGWWAQLIGEGQTIDTRRYSILCFDIPGNGYSGEILEDPERFSLRDVATLFIIAMERLGITHLDAMIGPSMGGAIVWQIAALRPSLAQRIFPIATDYRASDWLLGQTMVQQLLIRSSAHPLHDARIHAMLCYRTPESICRRFGGATEPRSGIPKVIDWLDYHGCALEERFLLSAYRTMTFLTGDIHVADDIRGLLHITGDIHIVSIDSDLLFPHFTAEQTVTDLTSHGHQATLHTIHSIHGHDAFLMEYDRLNSIIAPFFT